jgi:hypothetical protein
VANSIPIRLSKIEAKPGESSCRGVNFCGAASARNRPAASVNDP